MLRKSNLGRLFVFIKNENNHQSLSVDLNYDGTFSPTETFLISDSIHPTFLFSFKLFENGNPRKLDRQIKIYPYNGNYYYAFEDERVKELAILGSVTDYWHSNIDINGNSFDIVLQGLNEQNLKIYIKPDKFDFSNTNTYYNANFEYKLKDTVFIQNEVLSIDSVYMARSNYIVDLKRLANIRFQNIGHRIGQTIKEFDLPRSSGQVERVFNTSNNKDYTLIYFWGSWCGPCKETTIFFKELSKQFPDKLSVVGIAYEDSLEALNSFINQDKTPWINYFVPRKYDPTSILEELKINAFPSYILLDPQGQILFRDSGSENLSVITDIIQ